MDIPPVASLYAAAAAAMTGRKLRNQPISELLHFFRRKRIVSALKEAFAIGTVDIDDFQEWDEERIAMNEIHNEAALRYIWIWQLFLPFCSIEILFLKFKRELLYQVELPRSMSVSAEMRLQTYP
ncbi:MAG: hypothetical protein MR762_09405 [Clostridiales bacterium]|nr:hypothetical protein [Clostridiales bacterium]MCI6936844.1 hypothetical protein [Clostridiales bacterium]